MKKGFITIPIAIVLSLFAVGVGVYTEVSRRQVVDTSDWKTYRNEEYGFEIKIPSDWVLKNYSTGSLGINYSTQDTLDEKFTWTNEGYSFNLNVRNFDAGGGIRTDEDVERYYTFLPEIQDDLVWRDKEPHRGELGTGDYYFEIGFPNSYEDKNITEPKFTYKYSVNLSSKNLFYGFSYKLPEGVDNISYKTEVIEKMDQILSTFKFIDNLSVDTSGWKTYTNLQYGFEYKLPELWYVDDNLSLSTCCLNIMNYQYGSDKLFKGQVHIQTKAYSNSENKSDISEDVTYYVPQSSMSGIITTVYSSEIESSTAEIVRKILSTFRFRE